MWNTMKISGHDPWIAEDQLDCSFMHRLCRSLYSTNDMLRDLKKRRKTFGTGMSHDTIVG